MSMEDDLPWLIRDPIYRLPPPDTSKDRATPFSFAPSPEGFEVAKDMMTQIAQRSRERRRQEAAEQDAIEKTEPGELGMIHGPTTPLQSENQEAVPPQVRVRKTGEEQLSGEPFVVAVETLTHRALEDQGCLFSSSCEPASRV